MDLSDVMLRHRELTQEVYDIGDEVCVYAENLAQAIDDCDVELVEDCLAEFDDIVAEARSDVRVTVAELVGLRQALCSGVRAGSLSGFSREARGGRVQRPESVTCRDVVAQWPPSHGLVVVQELSAMLWGRTEMVSSQIRGVTDWVVDQTARAADDPSSLSMSVMISRAHRLVTEAAAAWLETVGYAHAGWCKSMRGSNPPEFLAERARIDQVVARVRQKLQAGASNARGGFAS